MNIGIDLRVLDEPFASGVARYARGMIFQLKKQLHGTAHRLIGFRSGRKLLSEKIIEEEKIIPLSNTFLNACTTIFQFPTSRQCYPGADLIWQPNPLFMSSPSVPLFVTIHDLSFVRQPETFAPHTRFWYLRYVRTFLSTARVGTYLLAVSEHTKDDILEFYPQWKDRVFVVSPPISPKKDEVILQKKSSSKYFIYIGAIELRKNIPSLIQGFVAFQKLHPEYQLYLVGHRGYLDGVTMESSSALLRKGIIVTEYLSEEQRHALLSNATALIYPSFYEGFGYPPNEAWAEGVPVIAAADTALIKTLGNAAVWINPYRLADELPKILEAVSSNADYRHHLIQKGFEQLRREQEKFTLEPLIELWKKSVSE